MSAENVKLALAALDAYNAGDLDVLMEFYAPDVEVVQTSPDGRTVRLEIYSDHDRAVKAAGLEE